MGQRLHHVLFDHATRDTKAFRHLGMTEAVELMQQERVPASGGQVRQRLGQNIDSLAVCGNSFKTGGFIGQFAMVSDIDQALPLHRPPAEMIGRDIVRNPEEIAARILDIRHFGHRPQPQKGLLRGIGGKAWASCSRRKIGDQLLILCRQQP